MRISLQCALGLVALVGAAACDSLTDVKATDVVQPSSLANATGAQALRVGALARFFNTQQSLANSGGTLADEFIAGYFNSNEDKRLLSTQPTTLTTLGSGVWVTGNQARLNATQAIVALRQSAPNPVANIGQLWSVVAYTELFFGENLCSPVPIGSTLPGEFEYGTPITRDSVLKRALAHFDTAIALSADTLRFVNLARVVGSPGTELEFAL